MNRRNLLTLLLAAPVAAMRRAEPAHPALDETWPLDLREGHRNLSVAESAALSVWVNGTKLGRCVGYDPRSRCALVRGPLCCPRALHVVRDASLRRA